ncbi:hypothetical protein F5Y08DRAFT_354725 [Xylaria arbuscula]|nr:hypothetical protein F5Y08DRAFT_354725 [Xylaria arbuscula]
MLTTLPISTSCLTEIWFSTIGDQANIVLGKPYDSSCWPGTWDLATTVSPALCPEGYRFAYEVTDSAEKGQGETVWACCPSNFVYDIGIWHCVRGQPGQTETYTITDIDSNGNTITTQIISDEGMNINAHSILVAFHSSDIFTQPTSTTQLSAPMTTSSPSTIPFPSNPVSSSSSQILPTAASIGIGVAVGGSTVILFTAIVWLIRRRFRKKQPKPTHEDTAQIPSKPYRSNLPEMHSENKPSELNAVAGTYELETQANGTTPMNRRT